jgi:tetratricopeptide (TPR) repeat protein
MALLARLEDSTLSHSILSYFLALRGALHLAHGQHEEARQCLVEATAFDHAETRRKAGGMLAELDLLQGDPEAARRRLEPLLRPPGKEERDAVFYHPALAWAYLELGEVDLAEEVANRFIEAAREGEARLGLVDGLRVRAMIDTHRQRYEEAESALEEVLELCHAMPYAYGELRVQYVYGLLHIAKGEPEQARARFEAGLDICRNLGERSYAEKIEQELTTLGMPPADD